MHALFNIPAEAHAKQMQHWAGLDWCAAIDLAHPIIHRLHLTSLIANIIVDCTIACSPSTPD
jgi:hydrogenase/urease accessory protein HupE